MLLYLSSPTIFQEPSNISFLPHPPDQLNCFSKNPGFQLLIFPVFQVWLKYGSISFSWCPSALKLMGSIFYYSIDCLQRRSYSLYKEFRTEFHFSDYESGHRLFYGTLGCRRCTWALSLLPVSHVLPGLQEKRTRPFHWCCFWLWLSMAFFRE